MIWCKTHDFLKILAELILNQSIDVHWICPGWSAGQQQQPKLPGSQPSHFWGFFNIFHICLPQDPQVIKVSVCISHITPSRKHTLVYLVYFHILPYTSLMIHGFQWHRIRGAGEGASEAPWLPQSPRGGHGDVAVLCTRWDLETGLRMSQGSHMLIQYKIIFRYK